MRVDPSGSHTPITQPTTRPVSRPEGQATPATGSSPAVETFAPTGELARLLEAVRATPDIRTEVVAEVTARLAAGEVLTPEAAADVARALINEATPNG